MTAKENEYRCAMCKGVFGKGWSDEEAEKEYQEYFPKCQDREIVCDDCFNKIHPKDHPMQVKLSNLS